MAIPFATQELEDGQRLALMEDIWSAVERWAKRNKHEYVASYGVVGVAPT